jgi:inositol-phosphate transport system permease protein
MEFRPTKGVGLAAAAALLALTAPILLLYAWLPVAAFGSRTVGLRPEGFTLEHWHRLLDPVGGATLPESLARSVVFSCLYCLLLLAAVVPAAYALSRLPLPGRRAFLALLLVLHAFPALSLLVGVYQVLRWMGLYDSLLGVALVKTATEVPLGVWALKGFFDRIPWELEAAALVDGSSRWLAFRKVCLPLARPGLFAVVAFAFVSGWNEFLLPYLFLPSASQWTLPLYVRSLIADFRFVDYGVVAAASIVYAAPPLILFALGQRYFLQLYFLGGRVQAQ